MKRRIRLFDTRILMRVFLLIIALAARKAAATVLPPILLTEAGGVPSSEGHWDWSVLSPPGILCSDQPSTPAAVLVRNGEMSLLKGPTPHQEVKIAHSSLVTYSPFTYATVQGPWVLIGNNASSGVLAIKLSANCTAVQTAKWSGDLMQGMQWRALTGDANTTIGVLVGAAEGVPAQLASLQVASDGTITATAGAHPLPNLVSGCQWRTAAILPAAATALSRSSGRTPSLRRLLASATCDASAPGANNTFLLGMDAKVMSSVAAYLGSGSSAWIGSVWADFLGDGTAGLGLLVAGAGAKNAPRVLPLHLEPPFAAEQTLVLGAPFELDHGNGSASVLRHWSGISAGSWLPSEPAGAVQLLALRTYDEAQQGTEFVLNTLVYAAPAAISARMLAISDTLGQQGISDSLNVSVTPAEFGKFNTSRLRDLYTATHMNTHNFKVCSAGDYHALVQLLRDTGSFAVDGRQFRVWTELLPPTEASPSGDNCVVPPDSPITPFNEPASAISTTRPGAKCSGGSLAHSRTSLRCRWTTSPTTCTAHRTPSSGPRSSPA
jgi:hypothetical protein